VRNRIEGQIQIDAEVSNPRQIDTNLFNTTEIRRSTETAPNLSYFKIIAEFITREKFRPYLILFMIFLTSFSVYYFGLKTIHVFMIDLIKKISVLIQNIIQGISRILSMLFWCTIQFSGIILNATKYISKIIQDVASIVFSFTMEVTWFIIKWMKIVFLVTSEMMLLISTTLRSILSILVKEEYWNLFIFFSCLYVVRIKFPRLFD
jgi:hypothetical protein